MTLSLVQVILFGWVIGIGIALRAYWRARFPRKQ